MERADYRLHTLGWRSFQDLCGTIAREVFGQDARFFGDGVDRGRDGAWRGTWTRDDKTTYSGSFAFQCKFTAKVDAAMTAHQVEGELAKVGALARNHLADNYFLMTNYRVSADQQAKIEKMIRGEGVREAVVLDRTWLTAIIHERPRLRLAVPRIYGLGDIRSLLSENALQQAKAILTYLGRDLDKLVVTGAHQKAARTLEEHGFVLLLGAPRVGKSIIAATLALAALDNWGADTFVVRSLDEIVALWRPDQPKQFFWMDDLFGTNQVDDKRIDTWNRSARHVAAAIAGGARIVCTSRLHLFRAAERR